MALSNVRRVPLCPGAFRIYADYSHTVGAAQETLAVEGVPVAVKLGSTDALGAASLVDASGDDITTSTSGAITTITFLNTAAVTAGKVVVDVQTGR